MACMCVHVSTRLIWDGQRFQKLHCYLCKKQEGACIQCEDCYKAYHAMCAQKHNCCVVWRKVNDIVVRWWSGVNRVTLFGWVFSSPTVENRDCEQRFLILRYFSGYTEGLHVLWRAPSTRHEMGRCVAEVAIRRCNGNAAP